jgi:hypothetical protein
MAQVTLPSWAMHTNFSIENLLGVGHWEDETLDVPV